MNNPEKRCAVCGDTEPLNVRLKWKRLSDGKIFNVCLACAELTDKVNAESVNNFGNYSGAECTSLIETPERRRRTSLYSLKNPPQFKRGE